MLKSRSTMRVGLALEAVAKSRGFRRPWMPFPRKSVTPLLNPCRAEIVTAPIHSGWHLKAPASDGGPFVLASKSWQPPLGTK